MEPSCNEKGVKIKICFNCHDVLVETIDKTNHVDKNSDNICDTCGKDLGPESHCSCSCHKSGFDKVLFVIVNFFQKLFGQNTVCECGAKH